MTASKEQEGHLSGEELTGTLAEYYLHQAILSPDASPENKESVIRDMLKKVRRRYHIVLVIGYPITPDDPPAERTETILHTPIAIAEKYLLRIRSGVIKGENNNGIPLTMEEIIQTAHEQNNTVYFEQLDRSVAPSLLTEFEPPKGPGKPRGRKKRLDG
jgi:hypothetical protein